MLLEHHMPEDQQDFQSARSAEVPEYDYIPASRAEGQPAHLRVCHTPVCLQVE